MELIWLNLHQKTRSVFDIL